MWELVFSLCLAGLELWSWGLATGTPYLLSHLSPWLWPCDPGKFSILLGLCMSSSAQWMGQDLQCLMFLKSYASYLERFLRPFPLPGSGAVWEGTQCVCVLRWGRGSVWFLPRKPHAESAWLQEGRVWAGRSVKGVLRDTSKRLRSLS